MDPIFCTQVEAFGAGLLAKVRGITVKLLVKKIELKDGRGYWHILGNEQYLKPSLAIHFFEIISDI